MRTNLLSLGMLLCFLLTQTHLRAQSNLTITGTVIEAASGDPLIGANVVVKDKVIGTVTDLQGNFSLNINESPPITLAISSVGYRTEEVTVNESITDLEVVLEEQTLLGQEVVVSASRVEESILESPVSIEKMDIRDIRAAAAPNFYTQIANLKGIDVSTQSITFNSINIRGFGGNGNTRTVQLIDGIDNQAPGLNFPVGNIVGITQLDLESVEILPGAASALYGPNALNGIILMNSKSPFEYQGLSARVQLGANHVDGEDHDPALYQQYGLRYAKAFNNKFAFKVTGEYLRAADFIGVDYRDQANLVERSGEVNPDDRASLRTYDGVNVYGDPLINLGVVAQGSDDPSLRAVSALLPLGEAGDFTPTGYTERQLLDNTASSLKLGAAVHYRLTDNLEALAQYNYGTGNSVYTGNDRYVFDDFSVQTGKIELRSNNFFVRAYATQEKSGNTYAANTLATLVNIRTVVPAYVGAFAAARTQGASIEQAHNTAREVSNEVRANDLQDGTFRRLADSLRAIPISEGGALFLDRTALWHYEGMYNFADIIDFADVIVGANFRQYDLFSDGTLFALQENGEEFNINEWGAYLQASKDLFDDKLDLSGSIRYDKNEYFRGQFTPRISGVFTFLENNNLRVSFQRGFRIPTTQNQFIDLDVVTRRLVGSNQALVDRYNFETNQVYLLESVQAAQENYRNTRDLEASRALLEPIVFEEFETEKVGTYEIGYKGLIDNKLLIDAYYYYSTYTDFLTGVNFIQSANIERDPNGDGIPPFEGEEDPDGIVRDEINLQEFGFVVNADGDVNVHGFAVGIDYALAKGFTLGGNVAYNRLLQQEELQARGFDGQFNTPEWRYNIKLANQKVTDKFGFNVIWRWQDAFLWESAFVSGIVPAYQTLDAQVSYKLPELKSILKLGGSNVLNNRYVTSIGNPRLGAIYYLSITFDEFLN